MDDFNEYLMDNFGKPINEISETGFGNTLVNINIKMISWDDVATYFNENNDEFNGRFSTADGLKILKKEDKTQLYFFEFKNINYSDDEDRQMSLFHLKEILKQMEGCEYDCEMTEKLEEQTKHLVDKSYVSMRSKLSDSLSLFYYMMKEFYDNEEENGANIEKLFKTEKYFFLVSNTESQYIPFKNKSNRKKSIIDPLNFLKRFEPYHYNMVFAVNKDGFYKYFYRRNIDYLN